MRSLKIMLNKIFFFIIFCLTSSVIEAEEKNNFDFLKDLGSEVEDSSEVIITQTSNNENEESADSSNQKETIPEFWQYYIENESYLENMNNSWNLARLFNRKNYNEDDFTHLTRECRFIQNESVFTSPDEKVSIIFSNTYVDKIMFFNLTKEDLLLLGMEESVTYEGLETIFGNQYYDSFKMDFIVNAYFEPDTLFANRFQYIFNFYSDEFVGIDIAPIKPDKIRLNENGEVKFLLYECLEGDCVNGYGVLRWTDGYVYKGTFSDYWPQDGIVYNINPLYNEFRKYTDYVDGKVTSGSTPTIFDPETYVKPIVNKLNAAAEEFRNLLKARQEVDYYLKRMEDEPNNLEYSKPNVIAYAERGIKYSQNSKEFTNEAYQILDNEGVCPDAKNKLSEIYYLIQDIEDIFWVLRHIGILNGDADQAQANVVNQYNYKVEQVDFEQVGEYLENCGYFEE